MIHGHDFDILPAHQHITRPSVSPDLPLTSFSWYQLALTCHADLNSEQVFSLIYFSRQDAFTWLCEYQVIAAHLLRSCVYKDLFSAKTNSLYTSRRLGRKYSRIEQNQSLWRKGKKKRYWKQNPADWLPKPGVVWSWLTGLVICWAHVRKPTRQIQDGGGERS